MIGNYKQSNFNDQKIFIVKMHNKQLVNCHLIRWNIIRKEISVILQFQKNIDVQFLRKH